jgi:predicted polyphosphate/ATP-dependent NAD kinase
MNQPAEKLIGLIVNPMAGIGGRVGLKGSDGVEIQQRALALGAQPRAVQRARQALERLAGLDDVTILTYPAEMGQDAAQACGFRTLVIGQIEPGRTSAEDTRTAAREMAARGVSLLLFAGGDGTARDIAGAIDGRIPVVGIPAGVKIHSAAFARNPDDAGELARLFLTGRIRDLLDAEVMDIDEELLRAGVVSPRLYAYLKVPSGRRLIQGLKAGSPVSERSAMVAIAHYVIDQMEPDCLYILGPGTTTQAIATELGLDKTLIGVDVIENGKLVAADANEARLLELLPGRRAKIVVTPIGGQGCLFGRGNQQISPAVIRQVGRQNILVVSTIQKIHALNGRPLWVDTGDPEVDRLLVGYIRVITGYNDTIIYRIER